MSDHKSWFHSNSMAGFNHFLDNVTKPFDKVDKKVNLVRKIPLVNNFMDYTRHHLGDTAAVAGLAAGAYFGGGAVLGAGGADAGAGAGEGALGGVGEGGAGAVGGLGGAGVEGGVAGGLGEGAAGDVGLGAAGDAGLGVIPSTSSGFGGVGTDAGVATSPDGGAALSSEQASAVNAARMQKFGQIMQQMGKQDKPREAAESRVNVEAPTLQNPYATSSKSMKTAASGNVQNALARGAAGCDPIDANGVQAAAIQEISKRIEAAKARLAELQKEKQ